MSYSLNDPVTLTLFVIKLVTVVFSFVLAFRIRKQSNYVLNRLLFAGLMGWGGYITLDTILYPIAPLSPTLFIVANVLRHFSMVSIGIVPIAFFLAAQVIKNGEDMALRQRRKQVIFWTCVNIALITALIFTDSIVVYNIGPPAKLINPSTLPPAPGVNYNVNFDTFSVKGQVAFFLYLGYCVWFVGDVIIMGTVIAKQRGPARLRSVLLMLGMLMIPLGISYFVIVGFVPMPIGIRNVLTIGGQLVWAASPILAYSGFAIKT
jgi:hypothetical protein